MRAALYFSKLRRGEEKHEQREFQIHVWCVNRKRQTAVSSKQFLNLQLLRSTSTKKKKKKKTCAAILNYTKDRSTLF